jgi:CBS domain-containing membrane protein
MKSEFDGIEDTAPRLVWSRYYSMFVAAPPGPGARERLVAVAGAIIGIVTTGLLCGVLAGSGAAHPLLVAPMGASAVLLFAVPASPLAQPWSVLGGNVLSALVGIAVALAVPNTTVAAGLGVGLAIAIMSLARCLHPPGGAVALSAVLGGAAGSAHPFMFALYPVGLNSLLLILAGLAFHRMSGHTYPHRVKLTDSTHGTQDSAPLSRSGVKPKDIDAALEGFGDTLDINRDDLLRIFELAGLNAAERQVEQLSCNDIMSRDVITIAATAPVEEAHRLLRARHLRALPVENVSGQLVGVITWPDLDKQGAFASEIMAPADTAHVSAPAAELLAPLASGHGHEVMIVDDNMQLQGIVTQTDIIASLITKAVTLNTK